MPRGSPFTRLCQSISEVKPNIGADLHIHSTFSDGDLTPAEIIHQASKVGLGACALTDHDTVAGVRQVWPGQHNQLEFIPGVEITSCYQGHIVHILGYYIDPEADQLCSCLDSICQQRRERLHIIIDRIGDIHPDFRSQAGRLLDSNTGSLGRRHLAKLLVQMKAVSSLHQAFSRYLNNSTRRSMVPFGIPVERALAVIRNSGGVASLAHPSENITFTDLQTLQKKGLAGLECYYPWSKPKHGKKLKLWATELGLLNTGGSDYHGQDQKGRSIGSFGIPAADLAKLKELRQ